MPSLANQLASRLDGEVRVDAGSRAIYATDPSNYRQVPLGVVLPRHAGDVIETLAFARRYGLAVLGRGGGTSLSGQTCNEGLVVDFSKYMNRITHLDPEARRARVEPGVVLDHLRLAAGRYGLTFGPDPATHQYCTLGGMIGNNSCGVRSVMAAHYGPGPTTAHNVHAMDVVLYDGTRLQLGPMGDADVASWRARGGRAAELAAQLLAFQRRHVDRIREEFPDIPRRVSGYNLPALLPDNGFHLARAVVGSESTLCLVLEATVELIDALPHRILVALGFPDGFAAADRVPEVMSHRPVGVEGLDEGLIEDLRRTGLGGEKLALLPEGKRGGCWSSSAPARARRRWSGAASLRAR